VLGVHLAPSSTDRLSARGKEKKRGGQATPMLIPLMAGKKGGKKQAGIQL